MSERTDSILRHLAAVSDERAARAADQALGARTTGVKRYQQARFQHTYADLLAHPRYGSAAHFFLNELYGPVDFSRRDIQFARIVPGLVRLFPAEISHTVEALAALHALSEHLDTEMARHVHDIPLDAAQYLRAWQLTGHPELRTRQIDLMLAVGRALDIYTQRPWLRRSLRMMRVPARATGMQALQSFLESGFDTFFEMHGAAEFLARIEASEREFVASLFRATPSEACVLGQLP